MSKIIVTGGAGFIGSTITDELISNDHEVLIIDNLSSGNMQNVNSKATFENCDIRDKQKIISIFENFQPEFVFHEAAQIDVRASVKDPSFDIDVNVLGSLNIIEASNACKVKKIMFASSGGAAYGDTDIIPTPETTREVPTSIYGISKLMTDRLLNFFHLQYGLKYTSLRYSNVYGPRQNPHGEAGVVAIFTKRMLNNEAVQINGTGLNKRDYVYVQDVAHANYLAMNSDYLGPINIGTGVETDVNTVFNMIKMATGSSVQEMHKEAGAGEQARSCLDITLAKNILNWQPQVQFEQGINNTALWFKSNL